MLLHAATAILLLLVLRNLTGLRRAGVKADATESEVASVAGLRPSDLAPVTQAGAFWRSAFVAAGVCIHPSHTLACTSGNSLAHHNLRSVLADQEQRNEAIQNYERAPQLKPDSAEAHNKLAIALATQGKLDEAIPHFQQALNLATAQNNPALAENIRTQLKSYQSLAPQPKTP
ncbi:MAG: tetratricopeptide repeat protein [Verrucomicrobia bacterium]|nr:tetratricopeptide repeat protein [Verrucomicrobiota bacterium]